MHNVLAAFPVGVQKQMLGEVLLPLIRRLQPEHACKITGMLLELDNSELLILLESELRLQARVAEAMCVLQPHDALVAQLSCGLVVQQLVADDTWLQLDDELRDKIMYKLAADPDELALILNSPVVAQHTLALQDLLRRLAAVARAKAKALMASSGRAPLAHGS